MKHSRAPCAANSVALSAAKGRVTHVDESELVALERLNMPAESVIPRLVDQVRKLQLANERLTVERDTLKETLDYYI